MHSDDKFNVPKLSIDGANWVDYRDRVLWLLESQNIEAHIADDSMPSSYTTQGKVGGLEPQDRWTKEEQVIRQVIGPSVPSAAFARIKGQKTVKGAWTTLKKIYEEKTRGLAADLMRRFRNTKCGENDNVRSHFEHMTNVREQLVAMGKAISDEDYTDILLTSLPPSYDQSCTSISHSIRVSGKPLLYSDLESMILDEFTQREIKKSKSNTTEEAFAAGNSKPKKQCSNCNKRGHVKADCWAKGGGKEGQGPKRNKDKGKDSSAAAEEKEIEAWAAMEETQAEEDDIEIAAAAGSPSAQPERVHRTATELYDSGASRHMSPFRDRFLNYQAIEPRAIAAANKGVFYAVGTGDLRIEVPHGECSTPILLKDVFHAPEMGLTIVSIDRICKAGNSVTFKDGTCTIKNKANKVIGVIPASANGLYKVVHAYAAITAP
jgi:hypothetical protein